MKKILLLTGLFLCAGLSLQAQTENINVPSGEISVGCSAYTNNVNRTWNVNTGQNTRVKIAYGISTEANFDWVTVNSVDASGNSVQLFRISGTSSGTIYSAFPTGKIQIVFTTDGSINCASHPAYTGFFISFDADDRTVIGTGPVLFQGSLSGHLTGNALRIQTNSGNLDLGSQDESSAHLSTDRSQFLFNKSLEINQPVRPTFVLRSSSAYLQIGIAEVAGDYCPWALPGDVTFRALNGPNNMNFFIPHNSNNGSRYIKFGDVANGGWVSIFNNRIMSIDGKLGIGTTSPISTLDIRGDVYLPFGQSYWIGSNQHSGPRLRMHHSGHDAYIDYQRNLYIRPNGINAAMTLTESGNMGIGIDNPTRKLEVNGTLRAKEVQIETTGWPDFVFSPGYRLLPLNKVAEHIQEFRHLPNIPSAQEVAEQGINLGEMQAKLLQKIEELTLYVIEQAHTIQELKAEINRLKEK